MGAPATIGPSMSRLVRARAIVAELVATDPTYLPIFERLDGEVEMAEAAQVKDPVLLARILAEQRKAIA